MKNKLEIHLGLQGEIVVTLPSGRELSLQRDTAEATIRKLLTPPPAHASATSSIQPPPYSIRQISHFTKTGRPIHPNLTLEDLDL